MSLFASLGQGDIWALSGISFASPINDLLEKGVFTLENLLEEDELIQEVKAKNELLIEFLSREETIDHLLDFIILPVDPAEGELRTFKYPYMSCEVICCESPEILNSLIEKGDGKFLNKLFTFLSGEKRLDYYLAGYFEKILEMLFRRMTVPMMKYFNDAGTALLVKFLNHMDNYSIMQIVQRLMLPHIPFSNLNDNDADLSDEERLQRQCNWSYSVEACQLLLDRMLEYRDADVPLHISDLLITVLQLSPPETLVISFLCEPSCAQRLVRAVVGARSAPDTAASGGDDDRDLGQADIALPGELYTSAASVSLAAISVLESLNSRLFEASLPFDQSMSQTMESNNQDHLFVVREQIDTICNELLPYIPQLQEILQRYLTNNPCKTFLNQSKGQTNRLGHRGLQLVKLVESIVRMSNAAVDDAFCQTGLFKTCIGLFFRFENNSFLHLSVQRIVITILESDSTRSETQKYLLCECDLLKSLMSKICEYSTAPSAPPSKVASSASLKDQNAEGEDERGNGDSNGTSSDVSSNGNSTPASIMPKHSSVMGHLVLIAQALSVGLDAEGGAELHERAVDATEDGGVPELSNAEEGTNAAGANSFLTDSSEGSDDANAFSNKLNGMGLGAVDKPGSLRILLRGGGESEILLQEWDGFVQDTLHTILDHQMVGSYSALANLSALSQDDPLKLGVDMDMFHMNGGGGFQQSHLSSDMNSAGAWHRDQYGVEDDDEDDDDFMFQGPPGGSGPSRAFPDEGAADLGGFQTNFDAFSQRQDFTANGFDLSTGEVVAASFADFASFDDEFHGSASPDSYSQPASFDDFANFAEFDSAGSAEKVGDESAADVKTGEVDFAPSEF